MSRLILLRHAQASFGAERYDALSATGLRQAAHLGEYLAASGARFDRVWIGPRDRHRLTAQFALEPTGCDLPMQQDPALDEFAEGQQILAAAERRQNVPLRGEHALRGKVAARHYALEIDAWAAGRAQIDAVPSPDAFRATVAGWLARVTADDAPGRTVLAVTSGGVIAAVLAQVLGLRNESLATFMGVIHNASLTELAFSAGRAPALVSFNAATYLPEALLTRV